MKRGTASVPFRSTIEYNYCTFGERGSSSDYRCHSEERNDVGIFWYCV